MVLESLSHTFSNFNLKSLILLTLIVLILITIRKFSAGFKLNFKEDEINLNNKTYILIGGFSGAGLELTKSLAIRGAQIISLHSNPNSPTILQLILLLRSTTLNERIYADECDMTNLSSIRNFVKRWEKDARVGMVGDLEARIEGVIFCGDEENDYINFDETIIDQSEEGIEVKGKKFGGLGVGRIGVGLKEEREIVHTTRLLARFTFIQLLLPTLIKSSTHSAVRIISDISPFYSTKLFDLKDLDYKVRKYPLYEPWIVEGQIALASISLFRELQQRIDENKKNDTGGIVIMSVCGGFTRAWFRRTLRATKVGHSNSTWSGIILYFLLYPFIFFFCKSAEEAHQGLLAAVIGKVRKEAVPIILNEEESEEETRLRKEKEKKEKEELESKPPSVRLRGGMVYREGQEIRISLLEKAGAKLGADLWKIESKTVESLIAKIVNDEEVKLEKEKEDKKKKEKVV